MGPFPSRRRRSKRTRVMDADGLLEMFHCPYEGCSQVYVALSSFQVRPPPELAERGPPLFPAACVLASGQCGSWRAPLGPARCHWPASHAAVSQQLLTDPASATGHQASPRRLPLLLSSDLSCLLNQPLNSSCLYPGHLLGSGCPSPRKPTLVPQGGWGL